MNETYAMTENKIESNYYYDASRKYLVIRCQNPEQAENAYQYRMITSNPMDGFLQASIRSIDGENYLYYEITGMISLKDLCQGHSMDEHGIRGLLTAAARSGEILNRYLLDESGMIPDPEFIYYCYNLDRFIFTYFPGRQVSGGWNVLFDFLISVCNQQDKATIRALLRMGDVAERPHYFIKEEDIQREFDNKRQFGQEEPLIRNEMLRARHSFDEVLPFGNGEMGGMQDPGRTNGAAAPRAESEIYTGAQTRESQRPWNTEAYAFGDRGDTPGYRSDAMGYRSERERLYDNKLYGEEVTADTYPEEEPAPKEKGNGSMMGVMIGALIGLGTAVILLIVRSEVVLSAQAELVIRGGIAASLVVAIALAGYGTIKSFRKPRKEPSCATI